MRRSEKVAGVLAVVVALTATAVVVGTATPSDAPASGALPSTAASSAVPSTSAATTTASRPPVRTPVRTPAAVPVPDVDLVRPAGRVEFDVHDAQGRLLTFDEVREVQSDGAGESGYDDYLVDAQTLQVRSPWPLEDDGPDSFAVERPEGAVTLAMAWPTSDGYGQLLLDLPGPGRYEFTDLAAVQAQTELARQIAARPWYAPSAEAVRSRDRGAALLVQAHTATADAERGALAAQAYDAFVHAQLLVLQESGARAGGPPVVGVTFDDPARHDALASVADLTRGSVDGAGRSWVRFVFDADRSADSYVADVEAARAQGVHVVGQFLDSTDTASVTEAQWHERVADYVRVLPGVEEWEVGNEVNGAWTGPRSAEMARWAARHVRENSRARSLLTLYWQLGEGDPEESVFTWAAANLPPADLAGPDAGDVDDLGLSVYPEEHPLGASVDRVLRTLHRTYPRQRLLVSELGYGAEDLERTWWFGDRDDPQAGREAVARFYTGVVRGSPDSSGGTFWWYYLQDALPPSPVWQALAGR